MDAAFYDRLDARFLFVVGKGGVGKTTTASALALHFAEAGQQTHLISTDPAHSLGDVLGHAVGPVPAPSECSAKLIAEEFDARAYGDRLTARVAQPVAELLERGTYLDAGDAQSFLDLSIPGIDEVMAALRLSDLVAERAARIVVDTAPTGHTLRLLDAATFLRDWLRAFRAMGEKAGVVASRLMRTPMRMAAEDVLDELDARADAFERAVLRDARFVIVTRPGQVVQAETDRLRRQLKDRGLREAVVLSVGGDVSGAQTVPWTDAASGCAGLRAWGTERPAAAPPASVPAADAVTPHGSVTLLREGRELIFFAGKGGVGKSTCAAACALALAEHRHVSLYSTDPAGSLGDVFGVSLPAAGMEVVPNLFVRQVDAGLELERVRERYHSQIEQVFSQLGIGGEAALDRAVMDSLWNLAPPGVDEVFSLIEIMDAFERDPSETLIVDAAPTGHFLRLLELPELALDWSRALMRVLVKYQAALGLGDLAQEVLDLARNLKRLRERLADPGRTAVVAVTLEQPVVQAETERLEAALGRAGIRIAARLHNRAAPRAVGGGGGASAPAAIFAPRMTPPPVGADALREFAEQWVQAT